MNTTGQAWQKFQPPFDPRRMDGATVIEDEFGRLVETADCGTRCPGCGICCQGYRDPVREDYQGVEEHELNLQVLEFPNKIVKLGANFIYYCCECGNDCPGYGLCCPPEELRVNASTVSEANTVLLERDDATRAEIEDTLMFLAHEGTKEAVEILEKYQSKAHTRVLGFADCALDEGKYMSTVPRSEADKQRMLKEEVLKRYEEYICSAQSEIDETVLHEIDLLEYELEVARRVKEKQFSGTESMDWEMEINFLEVNLGMKRGRLEELQAEIGKYEALMAEVELDLKTGDL